MNYFWLMGAILAFIVFLIFMILPATRRIEIEMTFDPLGDWIEDIPIVWVWIIRLVSLVLTIAFALLYFS